MGQKNLTVSLDQFFWLTLYIDVVQVNYIPT